MNDKKQSVKKCKRCQQSMGFLDKPMETPIIDILFDSRSYQICSGNITRVTWNGNDNICEQDKNGFDDPPSPNDDCNWYFH